MYQFDPQKTRIAVQKISRQFPGQQRRQSQGLEKLFKRLATIKLASLGTWSKSLSGRDLDLLASHYHQAPSLPVMMAVALVLNHRKDGRACEVIRHCFLQNPSSRALSPFKTYIDANASHLVPGELEWMMDYLALDLQPALQDHVVNCLRQEPDLFDRWFGNASFDQPLMFALLDFIFREGGELVRKIGPETAAAWAKRLIEDHQDQKLCTYLNYYPENYWKPETLELLYAAKGPLDPKTQPFYGDLLPGRLWALRKKLFNGRMDDLRKARVHQEFWGHWVHLLSDWKSSGDTVVVLAGPLKIMVLTEKTVLNHVNPNAGSTQTIPHDHLWAENMGQILEHYLR